MFVHELCVCICVYGQGGGKGVCGGTTSMHAWVSSSALYDSVPHHETRYYGLYINNDLKYLYTTLQMRAELEVSLMEGAELVFTTLSSTGRHIFTRLKHTFDAVLIDEACQAAEVAALQPLIHGTGKVVLVGDPKQLPATLFSRAARDLALERSLFERLAQAGVPVKLLAVQYRMHPEIRAFPSAYFYDNALLDAQQVMALFSHEHCKMSIAKWALPRRTKACVFFQVGKVSSVETPLCR